jgi:hypothetical protein
MKKLSDVQREWIAWILIDQREWLDIHIMSQENRMRIQKAYINYEYDNVTERILNFILNAFNSNDGMKNKWKNERAWKIKSNN